MASVKAPGVRCDEVELEAWKAIAERLGVPLNRWARRALNEAAALDAALLREREATGADFVTRS